MDRIIKKKNIASKAMTALTSLLGKAGETFETLTGKDEGKTVTNATHLSGMDRAVEKTPWDKIKKPVMYGGGAVAILLLFLIFSPEGGRALKVQNDRIVVSEVIAGEFDDFIPVRGQIAPLRTVFLDAIEGGRVEGIFVEDGALVVAGQLLVVLSNTSLQLEVIGREAEVTEQLNNLRNTELSLEQNRLAHKSNLVEINYNIIRLEREIDRKRPLVKDGHVSEALFEQLVDEYDYYKARQEVTLESQASDERLQKTQMEQLRTAGAQLEKNLEVAKGNLDSLNMTAPVQGKLTAFNVEIGQSLNRGDSIGRIDDPTQFKVSANIDEFYLSRIDIDQTAYFTIGGSNYTLRVAKVYPQVTNGTFEVDLVFIGDVPENIRRGQTLQLNLQLGDPSRSVMIPNGAFYQDTGGNWIFVVTPDSSRAIRRNIKLGRRNVKFIEVIDGLEPGELVITSPYTNYLDMDRLELQAAN